jgi:hypothetical protein
MREWLAICNRECASAKNVRGKRGYPVDFYSSYAVPNLSCTPISLGRRIYVSTLRTSHGGARCHCSYPASRSLCCFTLNVRAGQDSFNSVPRFQCPLSLWSGRDVSWEVRSSLTSFLLTLPAVAAILRCFDRSGDWRRQRAGVPGWLAGEDGGEEEKKGCSSGWDEESGAQAVKLGGEDAG